MCENNNLYAPQPQKIATAGVMEQLISQPFTVPSSGDSNALSNSAAAIFINVVGNFTMENILKEISKKAIELGDFEFDEQQIKSKWLGTLPVSEIEIKTTESRLGIKLPADYKYFLTITNGFSAPIDIEPTFEQIDKIDYLKNIDSFLIEVWNKDSLIDIGREIERSIVVGGIYEEQYFLLIPPIEEKDKWKYWRFSSWQPGEDSYDNLEHYFNDVLDFINDQVENK